MSYTTLGTVVLANAVFVNDRKNSAVNIETKNTEDGRKFVFVKPLQHSKDPILNCQITYSSLKALEAIRDSANVVMLTMKDTRVFAVMIKEIDPKAFYDFIEYANDDLFDVTITLIEV